jgi:hypothetical protein
MSPVMGDASVPRPDLSTARRHRMRFGRLMPLAMALAFASGLGALAALSAEDSWIQPIVASVLSGKSDDPRCLGWSKKGACAIVETEDAGERGGCYVHFLLIDAVEDRKIYDQAVHTDDIRPASDSPGDIAAAMCATEEGREFADRCLDYGIDRSGGPALAGFPLAYKGSTVEVRMIATPNSAGEDAAADAESPEEAARLRAPDIAVVASRSGRGKKTLTTISGVPATSFEVEGYYLSPYEGRILVVYSLSTRGFEGETNTQTDFSGCSLDVGYR